jgi:Cof subfamily protein (haloacid dehalogenase superfamily)
MIRLIVTDLDGTLLKPARGMSKANREALLKAQQMGIIVALATGRNHETVKVYAKMLQLKEHGGYLILNNGQQLIDMRTKVRQTNGYIEIEDAKVAFDLAQEMGVQLILGDDREMAFYTPTSLKPVRLLYQVLNKMMPYFGFAFRRIKIMGLLGFIRKHHIKTLKRREDITQEYNKAGFAHLRHKLDLAQAVIVDKMSDRFELMRVGETWLDVAPKGVSKLTGIQQIMAIHHIDPHQVLVLGDSQNDVTMLRAFSNSVAMGNAKDEIKAIAKDVTLTNGQDGVAVAIQKYVFDKR